mgnify:CR=1 FL=1
MAIDKIVPINIEDEMKSAYIDYSMSVIVSRALPDVRDGLKPVHRRILYGMNELGLQPGKPHRKSARVVGEVLGKYHPHGDGSVYDAMVRMAQNWSLRYPLVDGQGNFGHIDGDGPAAMRYTEARLDRISGELLDDIKKDTVDFQFNFDDSLKEPSVLPTKFPNLLINGSSGIAVGMATNMLPNNLSEVVDGINATIDDPEITLEELMKHVKGPDFPGGGIIYGTQGIKDAYETGRGKIILRGKAEIEQNAKGRERIIITEIPYQVNTNSLEKKIADLYRDGKITGISAIRNESDRTSGLRIVIELKSDAIAQVVLSKLYKYSPLQTSYGVNNIALVGGRPIQLSLKDLIDEFIKFRIEVIQRRTQFELQKAQDRAHILLGLLIAIDYIDEVINLIRHSATPEEAKLKLMKGEFIKDKDKFWKQFKPLIDNQGDSNKPAEGDVLTEIQAKAILEMRLQKLTGLEREKVRKEYDELQEKINDLLDILASPGRQRDIVKNELIEIKDKYGDPRRTQITYGEGEISLEDMIPNDEVVVTISDKGYIKRTKASEYRTQGRGGRGSKGSNTKSEDHIEHLFVTDTHNWLLLFTEMGKVHWMRIYQIPETSKTSSGRVIQNLLSIPKDDAIKGYINIKDLTDEEFLEKHAIIFCTKKGIVKKTSLKDYSRPRNNGIQAININDDDQLLEVRLTNGSSEILIAKKSGKLIRFQEEKVRNMGRTATGVKGVTLSDKMEDEVVGMITVDPSDPTINILVISEKGNGKRSPLDDYRVTNRGGKGVKTINVTDKTGALVALKVVREDDDLMITCKSGIVIRLSVSDLRVMGRATQGVKVIRLDEGDEIGDVAVIKDGGKETSEEYENTGLDEEDIAVESEDVNLLKAKENPVDDVEEEKEDSAADDIDPEDA